jgi:hypothetical protein
MKRIILIIFLFTGCSYIETENTTNLSPINFSNDLSLEEFKIKLDIYTSNSVYPNINN